MSLRTRPWNRIPQPVYSLSTLHQGKINMNICTYVTPITMDPKQYLVGVYHDTQTFTALQATGQGLLQSLTIPQAPLVRPLGQKSGQSFDKHTYLKNKSQRYHNLAYLPQSLSILHITVESWIPGIDHDLVICNVVSWKNLTNHTPLTLTYLKENKIIR